MAVARTPAVPDASLHAPLVLPTWQVCTEDEMQEAVLPRLEPIVQHLVFALGMARCSSAVH